MDRPDPLIVTAAFDAASAATFQRLRDAHFPPHLNIVPAHLTLFHALPAAIRQDVATAVQEECGTMAPLPFISGAARFLGRGVALPIAAPPLGAMRDRLARRFAPWLTPQDRQAFRAHVTVQNKVPPQEARALHAEFLQMAPVTGTLVGLDLWVYRGGPWEFVSRFAFTGVGGV